MFTFMAIHYFGAIHRAVKLREREKFSKNFRGDKNQHLSVLIFENCFQILIRI